jgi:hypothetical protein
LARVPITVMGFRCERCSHEWIPRGSAEEEPTVCPKCRSPYWNRPKKSMMTYDTFSKTVADTLRKAGRALTWTELRTEARLPQAFPNNQWVRRMEADIGLRRQRDPSGVIHWQLGGAADSSKSNAETSKTAHSVTTRSRRK